MKRVLGIILIREHLFEVFLVEMSYLPLHFRHCPHQFYYSYSNHCTKSNQYQLSLHNNKMDEHITPRSTQTPVFKQRFPTLTRQSRRTQIASLLKSNNTATRSFRVITQLMSLVKQEPLFQPFANNFRVMSQVCQKIQIRSYDKDQTIYRIRERADYFYILFEGTVHLTIPAQREQNQEDEAEINLEKLNPTQSDLFNAFLDMVTSDNKLGKAQPGGVQSQISAEKILEIIQQGQSFGEILQDSTLRLTNAQAAEKCELLCLDKNTYESLLKAQLKSENQNKYNFLQRIPLFQLLSPFVLSRISVMMKQERLQYGQTLFRCAQLIKNIYVVKSGSFKLLRPISRHSTISRHSRVTVNSKLQELKTKNQDKRNAEYLAINEGEVLGDSQTLGMKPNYQQTCICQSQQAYVLFIDKKQLFKIFLESQQVFMKIKETITSKNVWRNAIVNSFVDRRTRNSFMNAYLSNPKRSVTEASKESKGFSISISQQSQNETFFYNRFNRTIVTTANKCRFSINKGKTYTQSIAPNLFASVKRKKQGIPHGIQDIVSLVKLKAQFQRRFRKQRKNRVLFKFNQNEVPLYIKSKFDKHS